MLSDAALLSSQAASTAAASSPGWFTSAVVAALVAAAVALVTLALNGRRNRLDRQRQLFAEAFGSVMQYREYIFIVRRRPDDDPATRHQITSDLSAVQAALNTYRAQLKIEAPAVGRAYDELVRETRRMAGPLITDAWNREPPAVDSQVPAPDVDISSLDSFDKAFTDVVADHLSVLWAPLRKRLRRRR